MTRPRLEWLGHAAVLVTTSAGRRVLFDPYQPGGFDGRIAHGPIPGPIDVVVLTHHHADHAWLTPAFGAPRVVDRSCRLGELTFRTVPAWHDRERGARMGLVRLVAMVADGRRVVHLGDLGVPPTAAQARRLGRPDVLVVPVGGTFTLDAEAAADTVARLAPRTVVPVHYATARCRLALDGPEAFLDEARARGWPVRAVAASTLDLHRRGKDGLPEVVLLRPAL